jgi:hypothetical protein
MDTTERDGGGPDDGGANSSEGNSWHAPDAAGSDLVRTSRRAVIACVLGVMSLLLLPGLVFMKGLPHPLREAYPLITLGVSLSAALFGFFSLGDIGLSGGRLTGKAFAWIGAGAPLVQVLLFLFVIVPLGPRSYATRMVCGSNLSGIGKAILLYSNDYQDEFPRAGGRNSSWGRTADWTAPDRQRAYALQADGTGGAATISSSLYLLVKYAGVPPKMFLCLAARTRKGRERGVTEFKPGAYRLRDRKLTLTDFWDFGPDPTKHCSYAYQMVYAPYRLTVSSSDPAVAIAGDRNPWMDAPAAKAKDFSLFTPELPPFNGTSTAFRKCCD